MKYHNNFFISLNESLGEKIIFDDNLGSKVIIRQRTIINNFKEGLENGLNHLREGFKNL